MQETEKIWMNGELVDWADAKVHVGAHGLHYGTGVFEGIRCYETAEGPGRLPPDRPPAAARTTRRGCSTWSSRTRVEELRGASLELIGANGLPRVLPPPDRLLRLRRARRRRGGNPVEVVIMSWPWGAYLGEEGLRTGIRAKISSWKRIGAEHDPARREGDRHLPQLDARGRSRRTAPATTRRSCSPTRATSPTAPARTSSSSRTGRSTRPTSRRRSCPGITRDTVIQIAQDLGYEVVEKRADPHRPLPRRRGRS